MIKHCNTSKKKHCDTHEHVKQSSKCDSTRIIRHVLHGCYEYRALDGSNNGVFGQSSKQFKRLSPSDYADNLNEPSGANRPSAREISNEIFKQDNHTPNSKNASNMFWLWGQFIDHCITLTLPSDVDFSVPVPTGDPYFDPNSTGTATIAMNRSIPIPESGITSPREHLNILTPTIDSANIYGVTDKRIHFMREHKYGRMKVSGGKLLPFNTGEVPNAGHQKYADFVAGDVRANEHIGLSSIHTLFVREHNYWADKIYKYDCNLCDEQIFQVAKIIVEAEMQAITYNEFLPLLLGKDALEQYAGFDENVDPQISQEFAHSAYRFGHSLVSASVYDGSDVYNFKDTFFASQLVCNYGGIDDILKRHIKTVCQQLDAKFDDVLRNFLFGPPGAGGHDLAALNLQRARDHGIPDYNTVRQSIGLTPITSFAELTNDISVQNKLQQLYGDVNNIDLFVGGLVEKPATGSMLGSVFHKIVKEQFETIRDGDKFWYENRLDRTLVHCINKVKLSDIIKRNTDVCNVHKYVMQVYDDCNKTKHTYDSSHNHNHNHNNNHNHDHNCCH